MSGQGGIYPGPDGQPLHGDGKPVGRPSGYPPKREYFTITPMDAKVSEDQLTRFMLDVYEYPCMSEKFVALLNEHTGLKWEHLGTYMDNACFATKGEVTQQFKIPYPSNQL